MSEDDKGKRFLELIDEQNNLQWSIIEKLSSLIGSEWKSIEKQNEIESLVAKPMERAAWTLFKFSSPYLAVLFIALMVDSAL